ncbi:hypothetical protein FRC20_005395 [Serendipita sp. 405]|nr:hypothetical protein FRC20_005395 [Serendipita sp. 405]
MNPDVLPRNSLPLPGPPPNLPATVATQGSRGDEIQSQSWTSARQGSAYLQDSGFIAPPPPPPLPPKVPHSQALGNSDPNRNNYSEPLSASSNFAETERNRSSRIDTNDHIQSPLPLSTSPLSETPYIATGNQFQPSPSSSSDYRPADVSPSSSPLVSPLPPPISFTPGLYSPSSSSRATPMSNTYLFHTNQSHMHRPPPPPVYPQTLHPSSPATHPLLPSHAYNHHNSLPNFHSPYSYGYPHSQQHPFHSTYPPPNTIPSGQIGTFYDATTSHIYPRFNYVSASGPSRSSSTPSPPPRPPKPPELGFRQNGTSSSKRGPPNDAKDTNANSAPSDIMGSAEVSVGDGEVGQKSSAIPYGGGSFNATKSPDSDVKASHFEFGSSSLPSPQPPLDSPCITGPEMKAPLDYLGNVAIKADGTPYLERREVSTASLGEYSRGAYASGKKTAPQEASREDDDVNSDSGMTMEGYDPGAYDFPRMVNQDMVTAVARQLPDHDPTSESSPAATQSRPRSSMDSSGYRIQDGTGHFQSTITGDVDSPPPYEQISSILQIAEGPQRVTDVPPNISSSDERNNYGHSRAELSAPASQPPEFRSPKLSGLTDATATERGLPDFLFNSTTLSSSPSEATGSRFSPTGLLHAGLNKDSQSSKSPLLDDGMNPAIITSPPTPSPSHSRTNSKSSPTISRASKPSYFSLPRRFTVSSTGSPTSLTPSSESDNPFHDPPTFQSDTSPFALNTSDSYPAVDTEPTEVGSWANNRIPSGIWNTIAASASAPQSEASSDEVHRRRTSISQSYSYSPIEEISVGNGVGLAPVSHSHTSVQLDSGSGASGARNPIARNRLASGASVSSRMSLLFRNSYSSHGQNLVADGVVPHSQTSALTLGRRSGIDLLDDSRISDDWEANTSRDQIETALSGLSLSASNMPTPLSDIWTGIEFGFLSPDWQVPAKQGLDPRSGWNDNITLYGAGSHPFFIRALSWRSLLRFLASQSSTRIEPSVEALATSRNPTIDLRLVVQFVQPPYSSRVASREVCLYFMLHSEMPAPHTKLGRTIPTSERQSMELWDTSVLPYKFVCGDKSLLRKPSGEARERLTTNQYESTSMPIRLQDPDGNISMFVTLPPPFIRLPVHLSAVAMYLHECFVLSRRHGKGKTAEEKNDGDRQVQSKIRKGSGMRSEEGQDQSGTHGDHQSTSSPPAVTVNGTERPELSPRSVIPSQIPGIKRLAKAIKKFYPEEYALGSSKSNAAAANAAVQDDRSPAEKITNVTNTNKHGGTNKTGLLGALSRIKGKSSAAKQAVAELSAAAGTHATRDTNAERYELVTPWTPRND